MFIIEQPSHPTLFPNVNINKAKLAHVASTFHIEDHMEKQSRPPDADQHPHAKTTFKKEQGTSLSVSIY